MGQLDQRVAVITGGGRGIGRAIALRYAAEGATIVISSRTADDLRSTLDAAAIGDDRGAAVVADATDRDDARRPVEEALARFGRVDVLVNNVGGHIGRRDAFTDDDGAFERTLVLSLTSAWWTSTAALPAMRDQGFGRIINIGSGASKRTGASVAYVTAKHGLVGLTRQLAADAAPHGINVNLLCPGWTRTSLLDFEAVARRAGHNRRDRGSTRGRRIAAASRAGRRGAHGDGSATGRSRWWRHHRAGDQRRRRL